MNERFTGTERYIATDDLMMAVNAGSPWPGPCSQGRAGTGKTQLAQEIARSLGALCRVAHQVHQQGAAGLYEYGRSLAVTRLAARRCARPRHQELHREGQAWKPSSRTCGPCCSSMRSTSRHRVSERSAARARLHGVLRLRDRELVKARHRPIILITSNNEKELPDAFLRRCFFHYIRFPDRRRCAPSSRCTSRLKQELLAEALTAFFEVRANAGIEEEALDLRAARLDQAAARGDIDPAALRSGDPKKTIPILHGALLKNEQDVHLFEQLVFLTAARLIALMLINSSSSCRQVGVPVTVTEFLTLLEALRERVRGIRAGLLLPRAHESREDSGTTIASIAVFGKCSPERRSCSRNSSRTVLSYLFMASLNTSFL